MVLLDMAEGEEADGAAGDGEDKAVENMEDDEDTGEKGFRRTRVTVYACILRAPCMGRRR